MIELGISTFGETTPIEHTGEVLSHDQRIRNMVKEIELADQVGLDIYAVGEHHRKDFAVSAPEIILAAGAVNTKHIKLSSAPQTFRPMIRCAYFKILQQWTLYPMVVQKSCLVAAHLLNLSHYLVIT